MVFNFKNNNFIIIFLLILVIGSSICYTMMQKNVEGLNVNIKDEYRDYFDDIDFSGVNTYYTLNVNKYDFSFVENTDIFTGVTNAIDISCDTRYCFNRTNFKKDSSFNIYKRINLLEIKTLNAQAETTDENIRLNATRVTDDTTNDKLDNVNILFVTKNTDPSFVFDLSGEKFTKLNLYINGEAIILSGVIKGFPNLDAETDTTTDPATATATGGNVSMGDFSPSLMFGLGGAGGGGLTAEQYAYMLETGNMHPYLNNYNSPFYSNFEAAMNNPSNPLVNPLNSINPQQYSESLFGPNISPHMVKEMCKNSKLDANSKVEKSNTSEDNKKKSESSNSSMNNAIQSNGNPMNDMFNRMNANSNSLLTQNSNDSSSSSSSNNSPNANNPTNSINNNGSEVPPCPPCARCPQSDFECKKVPNYEQGLENSSLPRAILTDFSTFGI